MECRFAGPPVSFQGINPVVERSYVFERGWSFLTGKPDIGGKQQFAQQNNQHRLMEVHHCAVARTSDLRGHFLRPLHKSVAFKQV